MELSIINHLFDPLRDKPCWLVQPGYGSFLTLEFGLPKLSIREPHDTSASIVQRTRTSAQRRIVSVHGEWHLWIYCSDWYVTRFGQLIGDSTTLRRRKHAAQELDGQMLTHVSVSPENGASTFTFDLGAQLITAPYDQESEQWFLYEPTGYVFSMRADGCYSHLLGTILSEHEQWHPLARTP
jgi:hypothetical protein